MDLGGVPIKKASPRLDEIAREEAVRRLRIRIRAAKSHRMNYWRRDLIKDDEALS
jgi:hypothetical protein